MKISMHTMALDSFLPSKVELVSARLAPDVYTLAQQVQQACHHAQDGVARLTYGILRHSGVALGVQDYRSQVGGFIEPQKGRGNGG
jgi:hypothetical protein